MVIFYCNKAQRTRCSYLQRSSRIEVTEPHAHAKEHLETRINVILGDDRGVQRGHGVAPHHPSAVDVSASMQDVLHSSGGVVEVMVRNHILLRSAVGRDVAVKTPRIAGNLLQEPVVRARRVAVLRTITIHVRQRNREGSF